MLTAASQNRYKGLLCVYGFLFRSFRVPILLSFVILVSVQLHAQQQESDTASKQGYNHIYQLYMNQIGGAALLYKGAEYEGSYPLIAGTPFSGDGGFRNGSLCYEDVLYESIPIAYDLVRNEVLIKGFQTFTIKLDKGKVCGFVADGHRYVHLFNSTNAADELPDDFYEVLYEGKVRAYAKHAKQIVRALHADAQDRFVEQVSYFVWKQGQYHRIDREKDLLNLFPEDKSKLKAFWKERHLNFGKAPGAFIQQTLSYWNQIKQ